MEQRDMRLGVYSALGLGQGLLMLTVNFYLTLTATFKNYKLK